MANISKSQIDKMVIERAKQILKEEWYNSSNTKDAIVGGLNFSPNDMQFLKSLEDMVPFNKKQPLNAVAPGDDVTLNWDNVEEYLSNLPIDQRIKRRLELHPFVDQIVVSEIKGDEVEIVSADNFMHRIILPINCVIKV